MRIAGLCVVLVASPLLADDYLLLPASTLLIEETREPYLSPLADLNGDGVLDFLAGSSAYLGTGSGSFERVVVSEEPIAVTGIGDVDADGAPDLLAVSGTVVAGGTGPADAQLELRLNRESGRSFPVVAAYRYPSALDELPRDMPLLTGFGTLADVNQDGSADIVAFGLLLREDPEMSSSILLVGFGPDPGNLGDFRSFPAVNLDRTIEGTNFGEPGEPITSDLNGDGFPDIAGAIQNDRFVGWVTVLLNAAGQGFEPPQAYPTLPGVQEPRPTQVAATDVDADGDMDLVAGHWKYQAFAVLDNHGDGTFAAGTPIVTEYVLEPRGSVAAFLPRVVEADDLNRDGNADAVVLSGDQLEIYFSFLDPDAGRRVLILGDLGCGSHGQLRLGDLDGDGTSDAVLKASNSIIVLQGLLHGGRFVRGDANDNGGLDLSDALTTLNYLFLGGSGPACYDAADANDDGSLSLPDPIALLNFLFLGGSRLPPPTESPGADPTPDMMTCLLSDV